MLWLVQNIVFSISLIVIIHYLYIYFETTLTAPKVKDLIHCPKQKYKSLFDTIHKNLDNTKSSSSSSSAASGASGASGASAASASSYTNIESNDSGAIQSSSIRDLGNYDESTVNDMKKDLKTFLRGIGLKSKSSNANSFRASYEMS
jgi:hypothetical protein